MTVQQGDLIHNVVIPFRQDGNDFDGEWIPAFAEMTKWMPAGVYPVTGMGRDVKNN